MPLGSNLVCHAARKWRGDTVLQWSFDGLTRESLNAMPERATLPASCRLERQ